MWFYLFSMIFQQGDRHDENVVGTLENITKCIISIINGDN